MHAIRSQARSVAWKYGDSEGKNYNPFARTARQIIRPADDEEQGLRRHRSTGDVETTIEMDRRTMNGNAFPPPHHAGTAPPVSATAEHPPVSFHSGSGQGNKAIESTGDVEKTMAQPADEAPRTNTDSTTEHSADTNNHPRRRKLEKFFGRSNQDEAPVVEEEDHEPGARGTKPKRKITAWSQVKATLFGSWINVLLICVPIGFALRYAHVNGVAVFVVNFIAIIPLAAMLSYATEELALYVGETLGGLLNASFGNATELIVGVIALAQKKILIVQTSLIGSMLSNLLLVLGMCFFFGGMNRTTQHFNITVAQTASSLLALSIGSLIIPTAFQKFGSTTDNTRTQAGVAPISRGSAVILLAVYGAYLFFQLKTHASTYNEPSQKSAKKKSSKKQKGEVLMGIARMGAGSAAATGGEVNQSNLVRDVDDEENEQPALTIVGALATLLFATVLIAFCSEFMVSGIDAISGSVSEEFIGLILIPIVGNAAEHATAVTVAIKDKMDLAIGVAVGSSMQIALLVLPLMVIISWCGLGQPDDMTLDFDGFQVAVLFIAVLLVNYLIQDGESHWLEGVLLQATYLIIAVTAWFYPTNGNVAG